MRYTIAKLTRILAVLILLAAVIFSACAGNKGLLDHSQTAMLLKYHMPDDRPLQYAASAKFVQDFEAPGRNFQIITDNTMKYSVTAKGLTGQDYQIGITIDAAKVTINSPQGEIIPDLTGIIGRDFGMFLTPVGDEYDFSGFDDLKYEIIPGRSQGFESSFQNLFPDLSDRELKIGDSWIAYDTISSRSENGEMLIVLESTNHLSGFEKINGYNCAKIEAEVKGTISATSHEQGIDLVTDGTITGTDLWYFAPAEGFLVKAISSAAGQGTITGNGPEKLSLPMHSEISMTIELLK